MKMQWIAPLMGIALVAAVPAPAWAHTAAYFDSHPSPHGGQKRMAGPYHIELVAKPGEVAVYLTTHAEQDVPTAGGEGKVVVSTGDKKTTIALTPAGKNVLKGKGEFTLEQDSTVVVFVKMPEQEAWGAEFMPLKPKANAEMHDMDHEHMDHEHMDHDMDEHHHDADHDHDAEDEHLHHDSD